MALDINLNLFNFEKNNCYLIVN